MNENMDAEQERERYLLQDRIGEVLRPFHEDTDYVIDDYVFGHYRYRIEAERLELLRPDVVASLQRSLAEFPNWEIVVVLGSSGGVIVRDDEIVDGLKRQDLPRDFQNIEYPGSRPLGSRFGDIMYSGLSVSLNAGSPFSVRIPEDSDIANLLQDPKVPRGGGRS